MSILIGRKTRVICQGLTGRQGRYHAERMLRYGTQLVAGVTPGKGGSEVLGLPVYDLVQDAVDATDADASIIFVPPASAVDAIMEAAKAGISLIVCITEGIPVQDMLALKAALSFYNTRLIGPNSPGIITPGECKMGIMPGQIHQPGIIGIVSRSGTLTYEAVQQTSKVGLGQSTVVGIGGDPVHGLGFIDCLEMFEADRKTKGIILVGEIGGSEEEAAAEYIRRHVRKPVVAYVAGISAPRNRRMGHAGAIVSQAQGSARSKYAALEEAGVMVVFNPAAMGAKMLEYFRG